MSTDTVLPLIEFEGFPKIPRLNRDCVITEKIDGTNACIIFVVDEDDESLLLEFAVQSRHRFITPDVVGESKTDNAGFAAWVYENAETLFTLLGPGRHYGEWWGSGIQRKYGKTGGEKFFSLFNAYRWKDTDFSSLPALGVVPTLYEGPFTTSAVNVVVEELARLGSAAAPGFMNPEGVIVRHEAARQLFKVTCIDDEKPKGSVEA